MNVLSLKDAPRVPFDLDGRIMFTGDLTEVVHLQLQAGEILAPHTNPLNVVFYCLEGEAILKVEDEEILFKRDDCMWLPSVKIRSWENTGEGIYRMLVIKEKH